LVRRSFHLVLFVLLAGALVPVAPTAASPAAAPHGSVHQLPGRNGCITMFASSESGARTCTNMRGPSENTTVQLSPDGKFLYSVGYPLDDTPPYPSILSILRRDPTDGTLTQVKGKAGCWSPDGSSEEGGGTCKNGRNIDTGDARSIAISKDGRYLYLSTQRKVGSDYFGGVSIFHRDPSTGLLTQFAGRAGCITSDGSSEDGAGTCRSGRELEYGASVQITPDQHYVYVNDYSDSPSGVAIFHRTADGQLHQLAGLDGCISEDGTSNGGATQVCRVAKLLGEPWEEAMPDNKFVYIANRNESLVAGFKRNANGGLVQLSGKSRCVSNDGSSQMGAGTCIQGRGLDDAERIVLSKNGRFMYTLGYGPEGMAVLNRNATTGALSERSGKAACYSPDGTSNSVSGLCRVGRGFDGGYAGDLSPDGETLYYAMDNLPGFVIFHVNRTTGAFTQLAGKNGCVSADGSSAAGPNTCINGKAVDGAYMVTVAANGRDVYLASGDSSSPYKQANGVAIFHAVT